MEPWDVYKVSMQERGSMRSLSNGLRWFARGKGGDCNEGCLLTHPVTLTPSSGTSNASGTSVSTTLVPNMAKRVSLREVAGGGSTAESDGSPALGAGAGAGAGHPPGVLMMTVREDEEGWWLATMRTWSGRWCVKEERRTGHRAWGRGAGGLHEAMFVPQRSAW